MPDHRRPGAAQIIGALLGLVLSAAVAAAGDDNPDLLAFTSRIDRLVDTPGTSSSAAAGLVNPAAWPIQGHAGFYVAWEEPAEEASDSLDLDDLTGVLSLGPLAFGMNRLVYDHAGLGERHLYDYTLGLGGGNRSVSAGFSYAWRRGWRGAPEAGFGPSERLAAGLIYRWRMASLGASYTYERESEDSFYQADLGLRPLGPRWTLFGDLSFRDGDSAYDLQTGEEYDDLIIGFGASLDLIPGLTLAARGRDSGEFSLRVDLSLPEGSAQNRRSISRLSGRFHFDDEQEHRSTTIAVEATEGHNLGQIFSFKKRYPELHLKGGMSYRNYRLFDDRRRFVDTLRRISDLAQDPTVGGVVINLSGMRVTPANLWELRAQLAGLRAKGKRVLVYFDRAGLFDYMLASVADEIWMDPLGDLDIKGLNLGRSYYRRLLDKMGVGIDEWRYFTYKSALEGFSRTSMSDADREQLDAFLQDLYGEAVRLARTARGVSEADWNALRDNKGELMADEALAAGLVDKLGDFHEARDAAEDMARRESDDLVVASLDGLFGDPVWGPQEWGEPTRLALLYAIGGCDMDTGIKGRELSKLIRKMRENDKVAAVVMRADSPGGDALPSDLVSRELKLTQDEKPVIVSQGQVAGSGGYWISMHSDAIYASPFTVTGSIGVISGHFWNKELGDKIGMDYDHVQIGESADIYSGPALPLLGMSIPHRPVTEKERQRGEYYMRALYEDFTKQVGEGRGMTPEAVDAIGQGRIWSGADGLEIGLVDELGGLWQSLLRAKEMAGIPSGRPIELVEGPSLGMLDPALFKPKFFGIRLPWFGGKAEAGKRPLAGEPWDSLPELERLYLEQLLAAQGKPVLMMAPIAIDGIDLVP